MLRKIMIVLMLCAVSLMFAEDQAMDTVQKYFKESTHENMLEAIKVLNGNAEMGLESNLYLAFIYQNEMNKNIEVMQENADSLSPKLQFNLANLLLDLGKYEEAAVIYDQLNEATPDWSCPWRHKGEALHKLGDPEKSEAALLKAIETRETHYDAYVMLADVQNDIGKYEEALKTLEKGFTYKGEDIEEADKELVDADVQFLYLELLEKNDRKDDYEKQKEMLMEKVPDDERLK